MTRGVIWDSHEDFGGGVGGTSAVRPDFLPRFEEPREAEVRHFDDVIGVQQQVLALQVSRRKTYLYLTTHSKHFIYGRSYGVRHMVKDHGDNEIGHTLHGLL